MEIEGEGDRKMEEEEVKGTQEDDKQKVGVEDPLVTEVEKGLQDMEVIEKPEGTTELEGEGLTLIEEQNKDGKEGEGTDKDNEGFRPPLPKSTLIIRKSSTVGSNGEATYVVSSNVGEGSGSGSGSGETAEKEKPTVVMKSHGKGPLPPHRSGGKGGTAPAVKRRPGRPVGSGLGPYSKKRKLEALRTGEVRVSSRHSTSIFKHDPTSGSSSGQSAVQDSPYIYTTAIRASQVSGGKPPISASHHRKSHKSHKKEKDPVDNIDPLTGKRRYRKRKKPEEKSIEEIMEEPSAPESEIEPEKEKPLKFHLSDNGVWRPTDDLRLIVNMEHTCDLESIYLGVKFSCHYTYQEIEERWRKLLYNDKSTLVAQNAINALHPDVKAKIYYESLFTDDEHKLLTTVPVPPDSNPDVSVFQKMLDDNPHIFNRYRTAKSLFAHWLDMKDFHLLENQNVMDYNPSLNFEDFEDACDTSNWQRQQTADHDSDDELENEQVSLELKTQERALRKKIRLLEDELNSWEAITGQVLEDAMKSNDMPPLPPEFDNKTYAVLRGKEVYYGMTSREIILGRSTKDCKVDADLTEEGNSKKISRKHAIIQLKPMGRFVIINKGKRHIFVDKKVVPYRCTAVLHDQAVIQIAQISLIFCINEPLIQKEIEKDVRGEIYSSLKGLEKESGSANRPLPTTSLSGMLRSHSSSFLPTTAGLRRAGSLDSADSVSTGTAPVIGDTDGTFVPICQPPASYVTIS